MEFQKRMEQQLKREYKYVGYKIPNLQKRKPRRPTYSKR